MSLWPKRSALPPLSAWPLAESIPNEPCDRCGAPSRHTVLVMYFKDGEVCRGMLSFCGHHYRVYEPGLIATGRRIPT